VQRRITCAVIAILVGALGLSLAPAACSQYSADFQTNIISGVANNWTGDYFVGNTNSGDALLVESGGLLSSGDGYIGFRVGANNNTAIVSGTGSVWSNNGVLAIGYSGVGSQLIITNGGAVYNGTGYVGGNPGSTGNTVLVTGSGSMWSTGDLYLLGERGKNQLMITMGGTVYSGTTYVGGSSEGNSTVSNRVLVSDPGSVWISGGSVIVGGYLPGEQLVVTNDGAMRVTNSTDGGYLVVDRATFLLDGGTVTVDHLQALNAYRSVVAFNGGVLNTKATAISNGSVFTVGNGTNAAALSLATGGLGFHSFANGLTISSNAMLNGIGTVIGGTTVNGGGVLAPGDGPGSITFSNNLTLAAGSMFAVALNGTGAGQYDQISALGTVSVSNSVLSVSLGYTPSAGDSFTIISNFGPSAVLGTFVDSQGDALTNGAEFPVDGTTFQIDYTANADGQDVILTALIPEPSSLLLATVGAVMLWPLLKRKQP
jgi:T5SS/PEP-CTERM-associated repeat protein